MRPISETSEADDQFGPFIYEDEDLLERLVVLSGRVVTQVPDCVGLSLSLADEGLTFTLVASSARIAMLDAVQYVDGGPRVDAIETEGEPVVGPGPGPLHEDEWRMFSSATAADGVASTLSLPIVDADRTIGGFNLYAASATAFDGHHGALAEILGAWADGAVTNADLAFSTRDLARRAPQLLRESTNLAVASALLASSRGLGADDAQTRLQHAAVQAGVPLPGLADLVIALLRGD